MRVHRVEPGKDHRLDVFKARQLRGRGPRIVGHRVADLGVAHVLDGGREESHLARRKLADLDRLGHQHAHRLDLERLAIRHQANALALAHRSLHHAHQHDHAAIRIEPRVEDQRLQRRIGVARRRRQPVNDRLQHLVHALPGLGAHRNRVGGVQSHSLFNRFLRAQNVRRRQIDLVDDRNDFEAVIDGQIGIGQRLRLHALAGIHHQQRALARGQRARNFVAEVHMARRVDQVQLVGIAVVRLVHHAHGVGLDGDAALPLQVHVVQNLGLHLAAGHRAGQLQQTVAQRRLAVVDVGNDREVAKEACVHEGLVSERSAIAPVPSALRRRRSLSWHSLSSA